MPRPYLSAKQQQKDGDSIASLCGASCVGYNSPSYWSWPAENPSIATAAVNQNPHILCVLLRAQIWMAPDKRYGTLF
jgi:hypothetical protein